MKFNWRTAMSTLVNALLVAGFSFLFFRWFGDDPATRRVVINRDLGTKGTVTGHSGARGSTTYLNSSGVPYNFDAFENDQLAPDEGLGSDLRGGEFLVKKANSDVLTLRRNGRVSRWRLVKDGGRAP